MSLPVVLRPLANVDVQQIHAELEAQTPGLGDIFLDRLQEAPDRIETTPELYAEVWRRVRAARLRKFRHTVYGVLFPPQEGRGNGSQHDKEEARWGNFHRNALDELDLDRLRCSGSRQTSESPRDVLITEVWRLPLRGRKQG